MVITNQNVLPERALKFFVPPQTLALLADVFATWLDAADHLVHGVLRADFDASMIGCIVSWFSPGASIKAVGKQAIHLGGALQVLFGIRGRRWQQIPSTAGLINEYLVRPSEQETPVSAKPVDEGCYW